MSALATSQDIDYQKYLTEHRKDLEKGYDHAQDEYDKTVLSLSAGALGVSFVFLKDVIGGKAIANPELLVAAWMAWAFSSLLVLISFYSSGQAMLKAIRQMDAGAVATLPGGWITRFTRALNIASGILFFTGLMLITRFVSLNLTSR